MEGAVMANVDLDGESGSAKANYSYLATGDYYFSNNKFRPFAGAGTGIYTFASVDFDSDTSLDNIPVSSKFGFMARGGFEYGHLRLGVEYNFVGQKMGYLGLKIGAVIGGGRK
jgi:outer membrane protein W